MGILASSLARYVSGAEIVHVSRNGRTIQLSARDGRRFEADTLIAADGVYSVVARLVALAELRGDAIIWTAMEDCEKGVPQRLLTSSIGRELQVLCSHTIHHYALIAFILAFAEFRGPFAL